jgi:hypothetical protein
MSKVPVNCAHLLFTFLQAAARPHFQEKRRPCPAQLLPQLIHLLLQAWRCEGSHEAGAALELLQLLLAGCWGCYVHQLGSKDLCEGCRRMQMQATR